MRRRRHALDLLPLLDVFMVVLFVFATIQEDRLDSSAERAEDLRRRLDEATAQTQQAQQSAQTDARAAAAARERLQAVQTALDERTRAQAQADAEGGDVIRRSDVLAKLLDHFSVFEVEIAGGFDPEGAILNRCCYRTDPLQSSWTKCGTVPPRSEERGEWLDDDAAALSAAMRRTKGGNAMVIVRQDTVATYRIANHVEELLRERFADHHVYAEGATALATACD